MSRTVWRKGGSPKDPLCLEESEKRKNMKYSSLLLCCVTLLIASVAWAQSPNAPTVLINELTQQPINDDTKKVVVFIHGWNPSGAPDAYAASASTEWSNLKTQMEASLAGTDWSLVLYHWETDADTGSINFNVKEDVQNAANAANNAYQNGISIATLLINEAPDLREVHFIPHSDGTWAAYSAALTLLQNNPYVVVEITLLDPFIPDSVPYPLTPQSNLNNSDISDMELLPLLYENRVFRLENYYANDSPVEWNAFPWGTFTFPTVGTQDTFNWDRTSDINQEVDWGGPLVNPPYDPLTMPIPPSFFYTANYDWHSGPIWFYCDTVKASLGLGVGSGLSGNGCPFTYNQVGWYSSLFSERNSLPQITSQPQNQTVSPGNVTLSVSVSNPSSISYQWYKNKSLIPGANSASYSFTDTSDPPTPYVVEVSNATGSLFSDKAVVSVYASLPTITYVSPATLPPLNTAQTITITGSNFQPSGVNASTLILFDPANNPYPVTPNSVTATSIQCNFNV